MNWIKKEIAEFCAFTGAGTIVWLVLFSVVENSPEARITAIAHVLAGAWATGFAIWAVWRGLCWFWNLLGRLEVE